MAVEQVAAVLQTDVDAGLTDVDASTRLRRDGPNELKASAARPVWKVLLAQYRDFMQLLLIGAGVISCVIGQYSTGVLLFGLTVLNALMGYRQEAKAEAAVAALADMMQMTARVIRDGRTVELDARDLVVGDVVEVEAGDVVPADGRLVRCATLEVEESALTGESQPSPKSADVVGEPGDVVALGDRHDMAYMNTQVTRGTGTFLVTATAMDTEMGRIAGMLDDVEVSLSPLQRQMDQLAKVFAYLAGATIALMVVAGLIRGLNRDDLFLLAITVAIGAIPTGLPIVVTSLLSIGTRQLAEQRAVVKDLTSVETLGSTSAICSDKTGTLTANEMRVERWWCDGALLDTPATGEPWRMLLSAVAVSHDAVVGADGALVGDPTEVAMLRAARAAGLDHAAELARLPRVDEVPFNSARKCMTTIHRLPEGGLLAVTKGAAEVVRG